MYSIFLVLIMIVAFLLILIIMVQNPKGGGLSSSFGAGGSQLGGVQNTNDFLDKGTWTLAIALLALILLSNFAAPKQGSAATESSLQNTIEQREIQETEIPTDSKTATPAETTTAQDTAK
ncbi:preprotein translocase subunit SecG [Aureivirga sp. CE67]|uniref:preprotein translocase subunit SecG n=1 Tax=Aureivirga sp. CE67 TaxID=1788983 RepID=UPI0018CA02B2|nr:preprotein translocase subunit SecG [Aureivirga sp. CE67]